MQAIRLTHFVGKLQQVRHGVCPGREYKYEWAQAIRVAVRFVNVERRRVRELFAEFRFNQFDNDRQHFVGSHDADDQDTLKTAQLAVPRIGEFRICVVGEVVVTSPVVEFPLEIVFHAFATIIITECRPWSSFSSRSKRNVENVCTRKINILYHQTRVTRSIDISRPSSCREANWTRGLARCFSVLRRRSRETIVLAYRFFSRRYINGTFYTNR